MTSPAPRRRLVVLGAGSAVALVCALLTLLGGTAPATAAPLPAGADPLRVVIDRLTPSTFPLDRPDRQVRITGRITNVDDVAWTDLNAYLLTSYDPMATSSEVRAAVDSDPAIYVGDRLISPGLFVPVPDLAAGESSTFRLSVPAGRLDISGQPGVYWLGVHVLGSSPEGNDDLADGRARTFLPLVPDTRRGTELGTELALGMPIRRHVVRASDGTVRFDRLWAAQLRGKGRLARVLELSASARDASTSARGSQDTAGDEVRSGFPLTWFVDGAVIDAVASLAAGNPPLDLAATSASEVTGPSDAPAGEDSAAAAAASTPDARSARRWLARFSDAASGASVLALPYGDLVVSAAVSGEGTLVERALAAGQRSLSEAGVDADPVVAPLDGFLSPTAARSLSPDVRVVVGAPALVKGPVTQAGSDDATVLTAPRGGTVVANPVAEDFWGPGPSATHTALAVRQRLLAEAAVHALSPDRDQPLVRVLPATWDPGRDWQRANFFRGLRVSWLRGVSLATLLDPAAIGTDVVRGEDLLYPQAAVEGEVPSYVVAAAADLVDHSQTLTELLTDESPVGDRIDRQAVLAASTWSRAFPGVAAERARGAGQRVEDWLSLITIRGPDFVTMSSETGTFQVTLVNGLDQPVRVGLSATVSGGRLQLTTPDPVELPPGGRRPMRIDADSTDIGIHQVLLQPVSDTGRPLGQVATLSVRSSKVGVILWVVMAAGAAALFGAIALRLVRRLLAFRRRSRGQAAS